MESILLKSILIHHRNVALSILSLHHCTSLFKATLILKVSLINNDAEGLVLRKSKLLNCITHLCGSTESVSRSTAIVVTGDNCLCCHELDGLYSIPLIVIGCSTLNTRLFCVRLCELIAILRKKIDCHF